MQRKASSSAPAVTPTGENRTVTLRRPANAELRPREYLTDDEVTRLIEAARQRPGRYGFRDATMILVTYLHGLRVSEVCALRWDQLESAAASSTSAGARAGSPPFTRCVAASCVPCAACNASRGRHRRSCSPLSAWRR